MQTTSVNTAADIADYFTFGLQAGGLEAFWGSGPDAPGSHPTPNNIPFEDVHQVRLSGNEFREE